MRVALVMALTGLASAAAADVSVTDRLADCMDVRAKAQAKLTWLSAPCQMDQSCSAYAENMYLPYQEAACIDETIGICATQYDGDASGQAACYASLDGFMTDRLAALNADELRGRLERHASAQPGGTHRATQRRLADLARPSEVACATSRHLNVYDMEDAAFCKRMSDAMTYMKRREIKGWLDSVETSE